MIPFPDDRSSSELTEDIIYGKDAETTVGSAVPFDMGLLLGSGPSPDDSHALYRFNTADPVDSVSILLNPDYTTAAFIGVADYQTKRWRWWGPFTATKTFAIDGGAFVSPAGNVWLAVMAYQSQALVEAISLRKIVVDNQRPFPAFVASPEGGIAPVNITFDASASTDDGAIIQYAWDWDNDSIFDSFSSEPQMTHIFTVGGNFSIKLRVTDDQLQQQTASKVVQVQPNQPPLAVITPHPSGGIAPATISFSGSESTAGGDPGDSITLYEWDFNGDGAYDSFGTTAGASHVYAVTGTFFPKLRVTDEAGLQDTAVSTIEMIDGLVVVIDDRSQLIHCNSMEIVNGNPAVVYKTLGAGLSYCRALDALGSAWGSPQDFNVSIWDSPDLCVVNGNPAICYSEWSGNGYTLTYRRSTDADGTTWDNPTQLEGGTAAQLGVTNGNPAISFAGVGGARYVRADDPDGSVYSPSVLVDAVTNWPFYAYTSLNTVNGKPAIAYNGDGISYCQANDADGSTWNTPELLAPGGYNVSLIVANGKPAIGFNGSFSLGFIHALDADGSSWGTVDTLYSGIASAFTVLQGQPVAGFVGLQGDTISYGRSFTIDGNLWWSSAVLLSPGGVGGQPADSAIAVVNGRAAICASRYDGLVFISGFDDE